MAQLSFFSAEANPPARADLAGLLCGPGRLVSFGRVAARLTVPVAESWRASALTVALAERGVDAGVLVTDDGLEVRTAFRADLMDLAAAWCAGAAKAPPAGLAVAGAALRLWVVAAGDWVDGGYVLGLDPLAPETYGPVGLAVAAAGLPTARYPDRERGAGLRVSGRRRLARLAELVGRPPSREAVCHWPAPSGMRADA